MQIACPNCGESTLRDPKVYQYLGTRCSKCSAEFDVADDGLRLVKVAVEETTKPGDEYRTYRPIRGPVSGFGSDDQRSELL